MEMKRSSRTVGVMGSGTDEHTKLANEVGALLARLDVNLLTGGGGGVMTSVSRAFTQSARTSGICIGIIPCAPGRPTQPRQGYPNAFVELAIFTHLPKSGDEGTDQLSRNHINVLSSTGIIALPGGKGTASEVSLALKYRKPVIAYAPDERLVAAFPQEVKRVTALKEVEDFLRVLLK